MSLRRVIVTATLTWLVPRVAVVAAWIALVVALAAAVGSASA